MKKLLRQVATWNILYDGNTRRVTTLLGFDSASVTHPCHEFFHGFEAFGTGARLGQEDDQFLHTSVLSGNFDQVPPSLSDEQRARWDVVKVWETALTARNMIRLSSIAGIEELMELRAFVDSICPRELRNKYLLKSVSKESQEQKRAETQVKLLEFLERHGY